MRIKIIISVLLIAAIVFSFNYFQSSSQVAKISFPLGNVLVLPKGKTKMQKAGFNQNLYAGDKVKTEKQARCEIKYNDGSVIRIDEQSLYTIINVRQTAKEKKSESFLSIGKLWANIKKLTSSSDSWLVRGPSAVVAVRGTVYRMDATADSTSTVWVYDGSVNVGPAGWQPGGTDVRQGQRNQPGPPQQVQGPQVVQGPREVSLEEWVEIVKAQQQITVKPDGSFQKADFDVAQDAQSSWVKWNQERDKLLER